MWYRKDKKNNFGGSQRRTSRFQLNQKNQLTLDHDHDSQIAADIQENLMKNYIKKGKMPEFTGQLEKHKDRWNAFVQYKCSELGIQMVQKAKENASKKVYHHALGQGGCMLAKPKCEKMKLDLIDKGIIPATIN
jgi:hypothetical protein